jgi:hypothetical protein
MIGPDVPTLSVPQSQVAIICYRRKQPFHSKPQPPALSDRAAVGNGRLAGRKITISQIEQSVQTQGYANDNEERSYEYEPCFEETPLEVVH